MMARIVAELGRPETPEETAARKAESSRRYRSSKTFRNLLAALLATVGVVAVVVLGVPRGDIAAPPAIDVAAEAAAVEQTLNRPVLRPELPGWRVNSVTLEGETVETWTVVYVPSDGQGYLRVAQGFDADEAWPVELLGGSRPTGSVTIDGILWDEYRITDTVRAGNVSYALYTEAGADGVLVYGSASEDAAGTAARALADGIRSLQQEEQP
jgi:hypothetical protein